MVLLGWGPSINQPQIHFISPGYLLGPNPLLKGSNMFSCSEALGLMAGHSSDSGFLDQLGLEEDHRHRPFSDRFTMASSVRLVVEVSTNLFGCD